MDPEIGTVWKNKTLKNEIITIVHPSQSNSSRKKIAYKYHSTGHIGGCNSCDWFHADWEPFQNTRLPSSSKKKVCESPQPNPGSWWNEISSGSLIQVLDEDSLLKDQTCAEIELTFQYKDGEEINKIRTMSKETFVNEFEHKFG